LPRAWYSESVSNFILEDESSIVGMLTTNSCRDGFEVNPRQESAWQQEISVLKQQLQEADTSFMNIFLEFNIPRMGRRIDALILIESDRPHIVIIEFKVGSTTFSAQDIDQVLDYALELKNFHEGSHFAEILPILISTDSSVFVDGSFHFENVKEGILKPVCIGPDSLAQVINLIAYSLGDVSPEQWESSPYKPTPTIIEAARTLYANHDVTEIMRSEGSAVDIKMTSEKLGDIITHAQKSNRKTIAFVTGVPGAGKTLVGLNMATMKRDKNDEEHAVFLSGNGPLVKVLQEALARDEHERTGKRLSIARTSVKSFIQTYTISEMKTSEIAFALLMSMLLFSMKLNALGTRIKLLTL